MTNAHVLAITEHWLDIPVTRCYQAYVCHCAAENNLLINETSLKWITSCPALNFSGLMVGDVDLVHFQMKLVCKLARMTIHHEGGPRIDPRIESALGVKAVADPADAYAALRSGLIQFGAKLGPELVR